VARRGKAAGETVVLRLSITGSTSSRLEVVLRSQDAETGHLGNPLVIGEEHTAPRSESGSKLQRVGGFQAAGRAEMGSKAEEREIEGDECDPGASRQDLLVVGRQRGPG